MVFDIEIRRLPSSHSVREELKSKQLFELNIRGIRYIYIRVNVWLNARVAFRMADDDDDRDGGNRCRSSQIDDSMGNYLSAGDKTLQRRRRLSTKSNGILQLGDEYSHFVVEHIVSISQKCLDFQ